ncbi:hypothetical protein ACHAXA_004632 [Cyclostephanos tholiformis]|uniref:Uncharacterized protein n=1 Tax=Cyclostephanos tholiformis TaxID=382380 RepID=A0ABD3R6E7_9STRA
MASELARLRSALQDLQSYELPANKCLIAIDKENHPNGVSNDANDNNDVDGHGGRDDYLKGNYPELLRRYKAARSAYVQRKTIEAFISSLRQYDPVTNTFPLPDNDNAADARAELARRQDEVLRAVSKTMEKVSEGADEVRMKWEQFCEKREELSQIVEGMERDERNRRLHGGGGDEFKRMDEESNWDDITEDDVALQEESLNELQQRKLELEHRLSTVRAQILDLDDDCHRAKRVVNEVRVKGGRQPLDWRGLISDGSEKTLNAGVVASIDQQLESELAEVEQKASELKKSCEFYDGIRELMDELGGVKILSSKSVSSASSDSVESPEKRQKLESESGFVLTLMLLGRHILEMTLSTSQTDKDGLRVLKAKITTPTTFPMPDALGNSTYAKHNEEAASLMETLHSVSLSNLSFSKIMSQKQSVEIKIPALDDLVTWSHSLESSSYGIRFILVETMARIRTLEARVVELSKLRQRYAAQVYDVDASSAQSGNAYGGAEQEVVCAINEGITVALRLGADCPLVPGSVYISEIFGVGGWDEDKLNELKSAISNKRCRGPLEVMQHMTDEICKRIREEGWVVPATPNLPRGKH